jgi:predicted O-methyltransferase YrrM
VPRFHQLKAYTNHWLNVVDEHSIHSPFFFDFYVNVLKASTNHPPLKKIEELRTKLLQNDLEINVVDYGAGSTHFISSKRQLSKIAATSLSPQAYCELYFRILKFIEAENVVELGTSLGVTTLYLAADKEMTVTTFEGSKELANVAMTNFEYFNAKNIEVIEGNIDDTLSDFLQDPTKINFALVDANHRYEPLMRYFTGLVWRMADKGIMVIDDIHHTPEMEKAWEELKKNELVYSSVDLFRCGLLFFDPILQKQHFVWNLE